MSEDKYEAQIETFDGDIITVEFERPGVITRWELLGDAPEGISERAAEAEEANGEDIEDWTWEMRDFEWFQRVLVEVTDLDEKIIEELPMTTFAKMVQPAVDMIADVDPGDVRIDTDEEPEESVMEVKELL